MSDEPRSVSRVLTAHLAGEPGAADELFALVYEELRQLADRRMQSERPDHTLEATAVVHEAWLRMIDLERMEWRSRTHFYAVAAQAIRRVLIDHARKKRSDKRGGDRQREPLFELEGWAAQRGIDLVELDDLLQRLAELHPRKARVVELRIFGGLGLEETAHVLEVGRDTVKRDWRTARAWLNQQLDPGRET